MDGGRGDQIPQELPSPDLALAFGLFMCCFSKQSGDRLPKMLVLGRSSRGLLACRMAVEWNGIGSFLEGIRSFSSRLYFLTGRLIRTISVAWTKLLIVLK